MKLKPKRELLGSSSCNRSYSLKSTGNGEVPRAERDSMPIEVRLATFSFQQAPSADIWPSLLSSNVLSSSDGPSIYRRVTTRQPHV
jgi:hypothetical protein